MKLKLEHLAPYLPYKVQGYHLEYKKYWYELCPENLNWVIVNNDWYKPILRPLSDLTKEIEVNREKFVPIDYNAFKESKDDIIEFQNKFLHYKAIKYGIIERLLSWHFDVFGLIENNLAIDINTL